MSISIAIDGPSGAGKSTLAKSVSKELDYLYVDTGAIYRTIGYAALVNKRDPKDAAAVAAMLPDLEIGLCYGADGLQHMTLNGKDVTEQIRLPETSLYICLKCSGSWPGRTTWSWMAGISEPWCSRTQR